MTLDGLLLVDKESGCTSHDVVQMVRRIFRQKRVGHCGTLDPDATGLLLLTLGQATRLTRFLIQARKIYEGSITFGLETDTYDASGRTIAERPVDGLSAPAIDAAMRAFSGTFEQRLPAYSAHKIQGVKLYEMARRGDEIPVANKVVTVDEFVRLTELTGGERPRIDFRLTCSSGTYARSLAHEVGAAVGTGGHLSALRRTRIGKPGLWFDIAQAIPLAEADRRHSAGSGLGDAWIPLAQIPLPFATAILDASQERRAVNGQTVILPALGGATGDWVRMVDRVGDLIAVGSIVEALGSSGTGVLQPRIVFKSGPDVVGFSRI
ncbi:MAG: tRNA pseudouridine(55) synthase TruB [Thermoanaerobaculia bacterium]